jgi:hypothetical protein
MKVIIVLMQLYDEPQPRRGSLFLTWNGLEAVLI